MLEFSALDFSFLDRSWEKIPMNDLVLSFMLVVVLGFIQKILYRSIRRGSEVLSNDQRRWTHLVRNTIWFLIITGLLLIWSPQLETLALSLTAFVVAIVIALKEVILCLTGAFMRVSTAPFRMGDWITVDGTTGEVVDINPFSVKVLELETDQKSFAFTGRIIQIPNSRYFTHMVENLSALKQFTPFRFTISVQIEHLSPAALEEALQEIITRESADYEKGAAAAYKKIIRKTTISLPGPVPQLLMVARDFGNVHFNLRLFLPTNEAPAIASRITRGFLDKVTAMKYAAALDKTRDDEQIKADTVPTPVKEPKAKKPS